MKYLSSDFVASYNEIQEDLAVQQAELDTKFKEKVDALVEREKSRLEAIVPEKFAPGETVEIIGSKLSFGKIVSSYVDFEVEIEDLDDRGSPLFGPGRFWPVRDLRDEEIVTCQGNFRKYLVEKVASELEKDWGVTSVTSTYYEDELLAVE